MKQLKILSLMMLVVMAMPMMVACGDDDGDNGGNGFSYTEAEIVEILTGKWTIYGHCIITNTDGNKFEDDYTGTVEFTDAKKYIFESSDIFFEGENLGDIIGGNNYHKYSILRENGKYYIVFDCGMYVYQHFQVVSLTKTTFKLVEDEDLFFYSSAGNKDRKAHYYITIVSE